jgi:SAM-dependent methyltransferase
VSFYAHFAEHYEAVFPFRERVYTFLRRYIRDDCRSVLDVGCATGHYCGRFAADGLAATGIDPDGAMIDMAIRTYPRAEYHCLDMRDVRRLRKTFDAAYATGNVVAHLPPSEFATFLADLAQLLPPGGAWIFQVVNWDHVLTRESYRFPPKILPDHNLRFDREYLDISVTGVRFRTRLAKEDETVFMEDTWLYPASSAHYEQLHRAAGFEPIDHFADYAGTPYEATADSASIFIFARSRHIQERSTR